MRKIRDIDPAEIYYKLKSIKKKRSLKFKNRIELCAFLDVAYISSGNSRILEDDYLAHIFKSHKKNNQIIITEIYDDYEDRLTEITTQFRYKEKLEFTKKYKDKAYGLGIYGIYVDNKLVYIGSSSNMADRIRDHCQKMYLKDNYPDFKYKYLHKCILEEKKISFEIIDDTITKETRYDTEYKYIEKYTPQFNIIGIKRTTPMYLTKEQRIQKYKEQIEIYENKIKYYQNNINKIKEKIEKLSLN